MEASPSPVDGARLLSGLRVTPSRGFKSRRLRSTQDEDGRALVDMLVEDITGIVRKALVEDFGRCPRGRDNGLHFKFAGPAGTALEAQPYRTVAKSPRVIKRISGTG